jgi:ABC-type Na+ efflux pump permease subunit
MSVPIGNYPTENVEKISNRLEYLKEKVSYTRAETGEIDDAISALTTRANTNSATLVTQSSAELNTLKAEIKQAQEDLKIAEERVATLRNPESKKSYYESLLPINRPLAQVTIVILLAIGIFFFILSFFIIINGLGFNLSVKAPWENEENVNMLVNLIPPVIRENFNYIVFGIIVLLVILNVVKK